MANFYNLRGTMFPSWTIGKYGPRIDQGLAPGDMDIIALDGTATSTSGGDIQNITGNALAGSNSNGGNFSAAGGNGDGTGNGGSVALSGGVAASTGLGGGVSMQGGQATAGGTGGVALLSGGPGSTGGNVLVQGGNALTGAPGDVTISTGTGGTGAGAITMNANGTAVYTADDVNMTMTTVGGLYQIGIDDTAFFTTTYPGAGVRRLNGTQEYFMGAFDITGPGTISGGGWRDTVSTASASFFAQSTDVRMQFFDGVANTTAFGITTAQTAFLAADNNNVMGWAATGGQTSVTVENDATTGGLTGELRFREQSTIGSNYVGFKAPDSIAANVVWTLPDTDAVSSGQTLLSDAAGTLSWGAPPTGSRIQDGDNNTFIEVDQAVGDDNTIRFSVGDNTAGWIGLSSIIQISAAAGYFSLLPTAAAGSGNTGSGFLVATGSGDGAGDGGAVSLLSGAGGASGNGGGVSITAGGAGATAGSGGDILFDAGAANNAAGIGGDITLRPGINTTVVGNNGAIIIENTSSAATGTPELQFRELSSIGSNYVGFKAPDSIATNVVWTLPAADGGDGDVLTTDGAGALSWASPSVYEVYDTGTQVVTTTPTAVSYDTERFANADFTNAAGVVTFNRAGRYAVEYSNSADSTNGSRDSVLHEVYLNGVAVAGSRSYSYHRNVVNGEDTASKKIIIDGVVATDTVEVRVNLIAGTGCSLIANACNLVIERVGP